MTKLFLCVFSVPILTGKRRIPRPKTRLMLAIFDPIMSPRDMSAAFCARDEKATNVSGREVPMAIIVAPITRGEIFILPANFSMNFKRRLAETIKKISENEKVRN